MTVTTETNFVIHQGNGVTTVFPYEFRIPEYEMLMVSIQDRATGQIDEVLTYPDDFSVTGISWANTGGGNVTYPLVGSPLPGTKNLVIQRITDYTQDLDIVNQGGFYPDSVENQLDKIVFQIQQLAADIDRVTLGPIGGGGSGEPGEDPTLVHSDAVDNIVVLTQAQYDALGTKVATTLYLIVN